MTANRRTREDLEFANRALARLLRMEPLALTLGSEPTLGDELLVCGILGGKDVGKSTLINALARMAVSRDDAEVGRGTDQPVAFVHQASARALERRFREASDRAHFSLVTHPSEALRDVVLIDMPDFDSEFHEHLDIVRSVVPLLDRVLWVATPRKLGDRAWVGLCRDVLKDAGNVLCVLNKLDELMADSDPFEDAVAQSARTGRAERFAQAQRHWLMSVAKSVGLTLPTGQFFLLAAAFPDVESFERRVAWMWDDPDWGRFAVDRAAVREVGEFSTRELERLRETVLAPVAADRARAAKQANVDAELSIGTDRLRDHFGLDRIRRRLRGACDDGNLRAVAAATLGPDGLDEIESALVRAVRPEKALADELLELRLDRHPLLRIVHWPFGWAARLVGSRLAAPGRDSAESPLAPDWNLMGTRLETLRSRILGDHAAVVKQLGLEDRVPGAGALADGLRRGVAACAQRLEADQLREALGTRRLGGWMINLFLWWSLLWFPLLQPILLAALSVLSGDGMDYARAAIVVVTSLGAGHLLSSLGVVAGIHLGVLALLHSSGRSRLRAIRNQETTASTIREGAEEVLSQEVAAPLSRPFAEAANELDRIVEKHLAA